MAVKYVKSSPARSASFKSHVEKVKLDTHGLLNLDVETRWNSTYLMLDTVVKFEKVFSRMYIDDHKYFNYCLELSGTAGHPSSEDWQNVKAFLNVDSILTNMAKKMKLKFDKYWADFENMNMLLFVVVVLDPRYKIKYVKFLFSKFYSSLEGKGKSTKVMDTLSRLYSHYKDSISGASNENIRDQTSASQTDTMHNCDVWQSQWEKFLEDENNIGNTSELEKYLMDDVEKNKDLNDLAGWKASSERYPVISMITRDVLAIPTSTVASKSAFSTGGWILDCYRSSLSTKIVEALVCCQQWLRSSSKECKLQDLLEEIQKLEMVEKEYPDTALSIDLFGA
ncbi:zinc finger BED domain-containing protein RICESLEEPER 2-like [Nicotiana tabacum]|uniref:Zinc finger BED domain-containing protein RICESLEEPER 2-like n=1 Tax=Nicotiana tabacum TaxID=4097 RepID=A0AC58RQ17_TOBAC